MQVDSKEQSNVHKEQQDLVDLPEQIPESPIKKVLFSPKIIVLASLALFFISKNLYTYYTREITEQQLKKAAQRPEPQMSPQMYDRFKWYAVLSVVLLVCYILLSRSNDRAQQQRIRAEIRKQEEEEEVMKSKAEQRRKIREKANQIVLSMDQFGNVVDNKSQSNKKQKQNQKQQKTNQNVELRKEDQIQQVVSDSHQQPKKQK